VGEEKGRDRDRERVRDREAGRKNGRMEREVREREGLELVESASI
jgi:hypothetical protein